MKRKIHSIVLSIFGLVLLLILVGCPNPVPTLSSLTPDTKVCHMPSFTLTVKGSDFTSDSAIVFNGVQKPTSLVSSSEMTCQVDPGDIAIGPASLPVLVRDTVSGEESNILYFTVKQYHTFSTPVQASSSLSLCCGVSGSPKIAVDTEKNINIVWGEGHPPDWEGYVYFVRSEDLGVTWINSQELPQPAPLGNFYPVIAVDESLNINVVFARQTTGDGTFDLYFLRSQEGEGLQWTVPLNMTFAFASLARYSDIGICQYNNTEHIAVVFNSYFWTAQCDIYFIYSSNSGVSWSLPAKVNDTAEHSTLDRMAVDPGGRVSVVWLDYSSSSNSYQIFFNHSPDLGATWGNPNMLSPNNVEVEFPDIAVGEPGYVYVVWVEQITDASFCVVFRSSDDYGSTWVQPLYFAENPNNQLEVAIAADNAGNINLYYYNSDGCFYRRSTDRGVSWESAISIPLPQPGSGDIALDDEGNIYLTISQGSSINFTYSQQ